MLSQIIFKTKSNAKCFFEKSTNKLSKIDSNVTDCFTYDDFVKYFRFCVFLIKFLIFENDTSFTLP